MGTAGDCPPRATLCLGLLVVRSAEPYLRGPFRGNRGPEHNPHCPPTAPAPRPRAWRGRVRAMTLQRQTRSFYL